MQIRLSGRKILSVSHVAVMGAICAGYLLSGSGAAAQPLNDADVAQMRKELQSLQQAQSQVAERIARIELSLNRIAPPLDRVERGAPTIVPQPEKPQGESLAGKLDVSGDLRLRYEANFENDSLPFRGREAIRGRLRGAYALSDWTTIGAGIATGDPDDPNTTDVTLSSFVDDLAVSLDQLYWRYSRGGWAINAGKFANPFDRTDLVWDGDVNPQGLNIGYEHAMDGGGSIAANAIYFIIAESSVGPESEMVGVQAKWSTGQLGNWSLGAAAGYYDYELSNIADADAGDFRSNLRAADGSYLSDFNLLDLLATLTYRGANERWPLSIVGDYVQNLGAETPADTGYSIDVLAGRLDQVHDYRFGYGYAEAETDAVLAAFSHDNTNLPTNYRQHTLTLDYVLADHIALNTTYYHYQPVDIVAGGMTPDWQDRLRLNLVFSF